MALLKKDGQVAANVPMNGVSHWLEENGFTSDDFEIELTSVEQRAAIRSSIERNAGDTLSILGTTADAAALSTLGIAALTTALASSDDFASFKQTYLGTIDQLGNGEDMVAISADLLSGVASGEVLIPAVAKGMGDVMDDMKSRSTAVSQALIAAKG